MGSVKQVIVDGKGEPQRSASQRLLDVNRHPARAPWPAIRRLFVPPGSILRSR